MVPYVSVGVLFVTLVLTGFFATVSRISVFILQGLHAYILPDESDKGAFDPSKGNGAEKEADATEKVKRKAGKKKKDKDIFAEAGAQILRMRLAESQLETRKYFQEYDEAVIYSSIGLGNLVTREILQLLARSSFGRNYGWTEALSPDDRISFIVGIFTVYKVLRLLAKVSYDPQLAHKSDRWLTWIVGSLGFAVASAVLIFVPTSIIDFGINDTLVDAGKSASSFMKKKGVETPEQLAISATSVKLFIALVAGIVSGVLFAPSLRNAKSFWSGTDQLQWDMIVLKGPRHVRPFLNLGIVLPMLVALLWVNPMTEVFVRPVNDTNYLGFSQGDAHHHVLRLSHGSEESDNRWEENQGCEAASSRECRAGQEGRLHVAEFITGQRHESSMGDLEEKNPGRFRPNNARFSVLQKERIQNVQEEEEETGVLSKVFMSRKYDWAAGFGVSEGTLSRIRIWSLFLSGLLQIFLFRVNLQTYCDGAVLIWYESLHQSKAHNSEVTKARIFLNNYFVCRIALQSLIPGILVLLVIGLARTRGSHLDTLAQDGALFFAPSFVRAVMYFSSWWLVFSSALQTWITVALFRVGLLRSTA